MPIVDISVSLIIQGFRTFAQVPASIKPAVQEQLAQLGLGTDGKPLGSA